MVLQVQKKLIISGPMTKTPVDWKAFLTNAENKKQLVGVISSVWSSSTFAIKLVNRKVILVSEGQGYLLQSRDGEIVEKQLLHNLTSDQEETDTRIILYCIHAQVLGYATVRIRSPDTDVFFIALHYALTLDIKILFDTGSGNRRRLLNVSELASELGQPDVHSTSWTPILYTL